VNLFPARRQKKANVRSARRWSQGAHNFDFQADFRDEGAGYRNRLDRGSAAWATEGGVVR
jgi:hypothetical protein